MENTQQFLERYSKHIHTAGMGVPGQEALLKARVLVIDAGDTGAPVLSHLAAAGIGTLGILSWEKLQLSDLPSRPFYFSNQTGKSLAQSAARQLRDINPDVRISLYEKAPSRSDILQTISDYDVVVNTTKDRHLALLVNDACILRGIPLVHGWINPPEGYVSVLNYKGGHTYRCMMEQTGLLNSETEEQRGITSIIAGITGSYLASETIKIITGVGNVTNEKVLIINALQNTFQSIRVEPNEANKIVGNFGEDYHPDATAASDAEAITSISAQLLLLKIKYKETLQLVDLRDTPAYELDPLSQVLHIPASELVNKLDKIHQDLPVVLISEDETVSERLAIVLNERHGFGNIYYLKGGIEAWEQEVKKASA